MNYSDALNYIKDTNNKGYNSFIVMINGEKQIKRLTIYRDTICVFAKRSRTKGFKITNVDNWESIAVKQIAKNTGERLRNKINKVIKYLNESGLWREHKASFEKLLTFDNETLSILFNSSYDEYNKFKNENNINISFDCYYNLLDRRIKTINYNKYSLGYVDFQFDRAIKNHEKYVYRWRKTYDNSIECEYDDKNDIMKAWYSEEYKGCLNGYYYLALDNKHALFIEKD